MTQENPQFTAWLKTNPKLNADGHRTDLYRWKHLRVTSTFINNNILDQQHLNVSPDHQYSKYV